MTQDTVLHILTIKCVRRGRRGERIHLAFCFPHLLNCVTLFFYSSGWNEYSKEHSFGNVRVKSVVLHRQGKWGFCALTQGHVTRSKDIHNWGGQDPAQYPTVYRTAPSPRLGPGQHPAKTYPIQNFNTKELRNSGLDELSLNLLLTLYPNEVWFFKKHKILFLFYSESAVGLGESLEQFPFMCWLHI